jgi:rhodanese-related sulfurtransferase
MTKTFRLLAALLLALVGTLGLTGCSDSKVDASTATAIIDVRTAAEFSAGHLEGAINIDVESAQFTDQISALDKAGTYLVYCHSGRRAGIAFDQMKQLGFSQVTNLGGLNDAASKTGLAVIAG